jgi:hypothetical protein
MVTSSHPRSTVRRLGLFERVYNRGVYQLDALLPGGKSHLQANRQTWRTSVSVFRERPGFQMQFDWTWPDVIVISEAVHYSGGALHNDDLVVPIDRISDS